jgi:soluble lytic murein transglycosylase
MGFKDWAEDEFTVVQELLKSSSRLTFQLAIFCDRYGLFWNRMKLCQNVLWEIPAVKKRALLKHFRILLHPLPFPVQVFENCAQQDLDPHLVYAIIREESRFDHTAVSRSGALGLMQLMPGTGKDVARHLDLPENVGDDLFAPEINLAFGIWYASYLLHRCGGDPLMMLAAYNAGLSNARRWFSKHHSGSDIPKIVDGIAYRETRNYVKRIVESAHKYHSLYFDANSTVGALQLQQK